MTKEIRTFIGMELRATGGGDEPRVIEGYAAKFGKYSQDLGGFREKIQPGAFTRAVNEKQDVRCLMNHDPNLVLGRTKNSTLTIEQDTVGLHYRCALPDTQTARDLHTSIARGDIDQCSFSFAVLQDQFTAEQDDNGDFFASRSLIDVDLFDVSPVTYPAYLDTEVHARVLPADNLQRLHEVRSMVDEKNAAKRKAVEDAAKRAMDPDGDGDDDSELLAAMAASRDACNALSVACDAARADLAEDSLIAFVSKANEAAAAITAASSAAMAELAEDTDRNADPAPVVDPAPPAEKREDSLEDAIGDVQEALKETFGMGSCGDAKYWTVETYEDGAIICDWESGEYFRIPYSKEGDKIVFGSMVPVEKEWVPSTDRAKARVEELRTAKAAAAKRDMEKCSCDHCNGEGAWDDPWNEGDDPMDDDCTNVECNCQNRMVAGDDARADSKVRTKRVAGKDLTASNFAYVGDPEKTETWKLPIHDAAHVRNALARFSQTKGIPSDKRAGVWRKIKAAAKKFGIEVSDDDNGRALSSFPPDEHERFELRARLQSAMSNN